MEQPLEDASIRELLDGIAAREPIPGGGAVAGVSAALGTALLCMVARYTMGNKGYADVHDEMQSILSRAEGRLNDAMSLAQADAEAYGRVRLALAAKKAEQDGWEPQLDAAYASATEIPLATAQLALDALVDAARLVEIGNRYLVSDVGVAAACLACAVEGAVMNVAVNAPSLPAQSRAQAEASSRQLQIDARTRSEAILESLSPAE